MNLRRREIRNLKADSNKLGRIVCLFVAIEKKMVIEDENKNLKRSRETQLKVKKEVSGSIQSKYRAKITRAITITAGLLQNIGKAYFKQMKAKECCCIY